MPRRLLAAVIPLLAAACGRPPADLPDSVLGHCVYVNSFVDQDECREFRGSDWTTAAAEASCADEGTTLQPGPCPYDDIIGFCVTGAGEQVLRYVTPGDDASRCAANQRACELFASSPSPTSACR